jgi:hypothetical protein
VSVNGLVLGKYIGGSAAGIVREAKVIISSLFGTTIIDDPPQSTVGPDVGLDAKVAAEIVQLSRGRDDDRMPDCRHDSRPLGP